MNEAEEVSSRITDRIVLAGQVIMLALVMTLCQLTFTVCNAFFNFWAQQVDMKLKVSPTFNSSMMQAC